MAISRSLWKSLLLFMSVIIIDRFTKMAAMVLLASGSYTLFPWVNFSLALNKGISWSLFWADSSISHCVLSSVIALVIAFFLWLTIYEYRMGRSVNAQACVLAGAVSNLVDRTLYGGVIDFIDIHWADWHFATFNVADSFIVLAILFLIKKVLIDDAATK